MHWNDNSHKQHKTSFTWRSDLWVSDLSLHGRCVPQSSQDSAKVVMSLSDFSRRPWRNLPPTSWWLIHLAAFLKKTIREIHVDRHVVGWSVGCHVDHPCGWEISPCLLGKSLIHRFGLAILVVWRSLSQLVSATIASQCWSLTRAEKSFHCLYQFWTSGVWIAKLKIRSFAAAVVSCSV